MPRIFNRRRAAAILVEATLKRDREVAIAHGVSVRSIESWRSRLRWDGELNELYVQLLGNAVADWLSQIPGTLEEAIAFIKAAAQQGDVKDPKMLSAVSDAVATLSEVLLIQEEVKARRKGQGLDEDE